MSVRPVLYSFRRCPYAMRARLALLISGTICELREVKLSAKPEAMTAISAKATVPVLQLADGTVLDESLDVMRWALTQADPEGWLDRADEALIAGNDGPFKFHLDRYKYSARYDDSDPLVHRAAAAQIVGDLEMRLARSANLSGAQRGFTDMAIMPFIRQFAATDRAWFAAQSWPHVQRWLERHLTAPLFKQAMIKLKPWTAGDEPVLFPDRSGG